MTGRAPAPRRVPEWSHPPEAPREADAAASGAASDRADWPPAGDVREPHALERPSCFRSCRLPDRRDALGSRVLRKGCPAAWPPPRLSAQAGVPARRSRRSYRAPGRRGRTRPGKSATERPSPGNRSPPLAGPAGEPASRLVEAPSGACALLGRSGEGANRPTGRRKLPSFLRLSGRCAGRRWRTANRWMPLPRRHRGCRPRGTARGATASRSAHGARRAPTAPGTAQAIGPVGEAISEGQIKSL